MSQRIRGSKHADLWHSLSLVFDSLGKDDGCPQLGLIGLGSFLWRSESTADLNGPAAVGQGTLAHGSPTENAEPTDPVYISNDDLLLSIRALAYVEQDRVLRSVDYRNLGSEELGSVYESLLELHPQMHVEAKTFSLNNAAGNERKTTGSYYTPDSLVQCLLDSALEPVVEQRLKDAKTISRRTLVPGSLPDDLPDWIDRIPADRRDVITSGNYTQIAEQAILALTVCDPACGSGHFLIAAAHRLARHLARVRTGESEPSPEDHQHALRDIIGRCIYGVDINPMAVELCKVSLWMEAIEPGKPLSFLDHHIQCGNSLLGTTPKLLADGIPNDAFKPIEGDDPQVCRELKARNNKERSGAKQGASQQELWNRDDGIKLGNMAETFARLSTGDDETVEAIRQKELEYAKAVRGDKYKYSCLLADLWCAAFLWKKDATDLGRLCPTQYYLKEVEKNPHSIPKAMEAEVRRLASQFQLFHWYLAFPDVFVVSPDEPSAFVGGFDTVVGNPPWEQTELKEKEWFAHRDAEIANAKTGAKRKKLIVKLEKENPCLWQDFKFAVRHHTNATKLLTKSGAFPLCARGRINLYSVFAERMRNLLGENARCGCIVPSGIATDDNTKFFLQDMVQSRSLVSIFDFENKDLIFSSVAPIVRFCLLTTGSGKTELTTEASFAFLARRIEHISDPARIFKLNNADFSVLNPNTRTCPIFRFRRDAEITKFIYRRIPVLQKDDDTDTTDHWSLNYRQGLFNMTSDSNHFKTYLELEKDGFTEMRNRFSSLDDTHIPLYEPKLFHQYNHRYNTFDGVAEASLHSTKAFAILLDDCALEDQYRTSRPRYWVDQKVVFKRWTFDRPWAIAVRGVTNPVTNRRTGIFTALPRVGVGHNAILFQSGGKHASMSDLLLANLNSFVADYIIRNKIGSYMSQFILNQIAVLSPKCYRDAQARSQTFRQNIVHFIRQRVLELVLTALDISEFGEDRGYDGPPFQWNTNRRQTMQWEIDALYFHLYLGTPEEWGADSAELREMFPTPRHAVEYMMETFPIVKRKDIARTEVKNEAGEVVTPGTYITKDTILEIYDEMATAIATGVPYQTRLDPPPGPPTDEAGNFIPMAQWDQNNWPSHIHRPRESDVVPVPVTPARTATPAPVTRVPGIAASLGGKFPVSDAQKLAVGIAADLAVRFSGSQEKVIRQYLGLATNPEAIGKLLAGEDKAAELATAISELPAAFRQINAGDAPWPKVFNALQKNDAIEATDTEPAIVSTGPESEAVIEHFGTLPDTYMQLVSLAIKSLHSEVSEALADDDARFVSEAQTPWLTDSTG
ncbi:Eco57I restriction-modification methylase domain-containing protein [Rhodopirellula sallentina]|uniref:site-specific DNA-methyltransferase (adenine-specific) n=1 Tax=Rhodopirellula sallentina SM41 TaxID=1263870 RepID=M5U0J4_9BACT|nr:N-6 DNA methylase [Rhodopirellula sallentina]EMI54987.1 type II DNA modification enzyme [Rhodopirellula sallentina SM41]